MGVGLILIALEELISNWDTITDSINGVTKEQKAQNKANEEGIKQAASLSSEVTGYINILTKETSKQEERAVALDVLNNKLGVL